MSATTLTRAERKVRNKEAHRIRRALTEADWAESKAKGDPIKWADIAAVYASIDTDTILSDFAAEVPPAAPTTAKREASNRPPKRTDSRRPRAKREAPPHVAGIAAEYRLAREVWEAGLAKALRGANPNGRPARGEKYIDEERDYRDKFPPPVYKDFLKDKYGEMRAERAAAITGMTEWEAAH